jgi:general nucleoside transport system permease protein
MVLLYVASFSAALGLTALLVVVVGGAPGSVLSSLIQGSVIGPESINQTIDTAAPILIVAVGAVIAVRAGMFNIGQQGQLTIGAIFGGMIAIKWHGPGPLVLVVVLLGSVVGGALWAGISALLKFTAKVDVVISSLLLIYVANQILAYSLSNTSILEEREGQVGLAAVSPLIPGGTHLPQLHLGSIVIGLDAILAVLIFVVGYVMLEHSIWGRHLKMTGLNPRASRWVGLRAVTIAGGGLILSGGLAGLAGGVMLTGSVYRVQEGFAGNIATDGLLAALVIFDVPILLLPVAFFFGMIETGGSYLVSTGVPQYLGQILESLLVLAAIFPPVFMQRQRWNRRIRVATGQRFGLLKDPVQ